MNILKKQCLDESGQNFSGWGGVNVHRNDLFLPGSYHVHEKLLNQFIFTSSLFSLYSSQGTTELTTVLIIDTSTPKTAAHNFLHH